MAPDASAKDNDSVPKAAAEEACEDYYYGLEGKVDYFKAFQCFEKQQDWPMLILMHLNGEGVPADVKKAEALFVANKQELTGFYIEEVQKAIDERSDDETGDYGKDLKTAQLAWIKYRDAWADLVLLLYKNQPKVQNPAVSIKTAVTRMRIDELKDGGG